MFEAIEARYRMSMITKVPYQSHMYRGSPMMSRLKKKRSENFAAFQLSMNIRERLRTVSADSRLTSKKYSEEQEHLAVNWSAPPTNPSTRVSYLNMSFRALLVSANTAAASGVAMTAGSVNEARTKSPVATNFGVMMVWTIDKAVRHANAK